jgi:hypothetical protein
MHGIDKSDCQPDRFKHGASGNPKALTDRDAKRAPPDRIIGHAHIMADRSHVSARCLSQMRNDVALGE